MNKITVRVSIHLQLIVFLENFSNGNAVFLFENLGGLWLILIQLRLEKTQQEKV